MGGKCTFWKRKKRNGEKRAKRFLGQFFRALKYVNFRFRTIKIKENRDDCAILQMYIFFGRCTFVMCILGTGCLMYWSEAVRSVPGATSEARREKRRFTKVNKQSLDLVQCWIFIWLIFNRLESCMYAKSILLVYWFFVSDCIIVYYGCFFGMQRPMHFFF